MQPSQKVNWLRPLTTHNGINLSISDNSGIVKIDIAGTGRRAPVLYADELLCLLEAAIELQRYLEANVDVAFSSDVAKESRSIKRNQERTKLHAVKAFQALGADADQVAAIMQVLSRANKPA